MNRSKPVDKLMSRMKNIDRLCSEIASFVRPDYRIEKNREELQAEMAELPETQRQARESESPGTALDP